MCVLYVVIYSMIGLVIAFWMKRHLYRTEHVKPETWNCAAVVILWPVIVIGFAWILFENKMNSLISD